MKIYLDACALNRLTDDQGQARVRAEAEAIDKILFLVDAGKLEWTTSRMLLTEILQNPNVEKRENALRLFTFGGPAFMPDETVIQRGRELAANGYGRFDALHLACAERLGVDVLLSTDDRFIRLAQRQAGKPAVSVANPVDWLTRVLPWLR